jgi:hypothetical protein
MGFRIDMPFYSILPHAINLISYPILMEDIWLGFFGMLLTKTKTYAKRLNGQLYQHTPIITADIRRVYQVLTMNFNLCHWHKKIVA